MAEIRRIELSSARIKRAKSDLKKALPDVMNSHRIEAFARGVGFKTYGALLSHVQASEARGQTRVPSSAFDGPFNDYFKNSDVILPTETTLTDMLRKWPEAGQ